MFSAKLRQQILQSIVKVFFKVVLDYLVKLSLHASSVKITNSALHLRLSEFQKFILCKCLLVCRCVFRCVLIYKCKLHEQTKKKLILFCTVYRCNLYNFSFFTGKSCKSRTKWNFCFR